MYPKKCACCQDGIIEERYDICAVCGWEDDIVQNEDEAFWGGANKESLSEYRMKYMKNKGEWINNVSIEYLEQTGLVKAYYTTIENSVWKFGKDGSIENTAKLAKTMGISTDKMVMLNQTHTNCVRTVFLEDGGEMVTRPLSVGGFDGMVTNEKGLMICTLEADCVPVYILDPVKKAVGMIHSGWRGTAGIIAVNAVNKMNEQFNTDVSNIMVYIGPCICKNCYEVGEELIEEFKVNYSDPEIESFFISKENGKYNLDLIKAVRISLEKAGVKSDNIHDSGICTFESDRLCSWRRDNPVMRSMLTGIMLK